MSKQKDLGKLGEDFACQYLVENEYNIEERNWRFSHAEIDIIARKENILIFIEVKTRSSVDFGRPEEFVSSKQEQLIADAATQYMNIIGHEWEIRFDIISIFFRSKSLYRVEHFEDAFFPGIK